MCVSVFQPVLSKLHLYLILSKLSFLNIVSMNDILSELGESSNTIGSTQNSNSEDELTLTPFFSSPTMKKILEVMVIQTFNRVLKPTLEKSIRNVVKHELELAENKFLFAKGNTEKDIQAPKPRSLKLKFLTNVFVPVLTGVEIKGGGGNSIEVALVDDNTGAIVDSGPEASAKVEIVALRGEFGDDDGGNWTAEEFFSNVVREMEGRSSLLAETVHVRLDKGIGSIDKIRFTHSSIYMRKGMFRLGARIVDTSDSIQVKEARTESFTVMDGRQLYNEKHDPPSLSDGVQRLKNIGRGSKYRLRDENVNTVEDFLIFLLKDPEQLKYHGFQRNVSSVGPARGASAISLNDCCSASISNLELSNSPIFSPSVHDFWTDQWNYPFEDFFFGFDAHQPNDASAAKINVHNRWKVLLNIFRQSSMRRRAAALADIQPPKKQRVF